MNNYRGAGHKIPVTAATGGVTGGTLYVGTNRAGVYDDDADGGDLVSVNLTGEYTVAKAAGVAMTVLDKVYSTSTGDATSATGAGNVPLGHASAVAATGDSTVQVVLAPF